MVEKYKHLIMVIIFIVVALVQISYVVKSPVKIDQVQLLYIAHDFIENGVIPSHGNINSHGAYNPPFHPWLYVPFMVFITNPSVVLILPGVILHGIALLLLFQMGQRYFSCRTGILSTIFYSFTFLGLYLGHTSWHALIAPLSVIILYFIFRWIMDGKGWAMAGGIIAVSYIAGLHWSGLLSILVFVILYFIFRPSIKRVSLVGGLVVAVLIWLPFLSLEIQRSFADVLILAKGPVDFVDPHEITPLCPPREEMYPEDSVKGEGGGIKNEIKSNFPSIYMFIRRVAINGIGFIRSFYINFYWSPLEPTTGTLYQKVQFSVMSLLFMLGLGYLLYKTFLQKKATQADRLLLLAFFIPVVLQNLTPFTAYERPDICWLVYGVQILMMSNVCAHPRLLKNVVYKVFLTLLILFLIIPPLYETVGRMNKWAAGESHPSHDMMTWVASDAKEHKHEAIAVQYDFLKDEKGWCWITSYTALDLMDTYYIGAEFDFLLEVIHGLNNTAKTADGLVEDPDYIVLFARGLSRYEDVDESNIFHFDNYVVIRSLPQP